MFIFGRCGRSARGRSADQDRMRFPRLSRVRTMLGAQPQEVSRPPELEKIMENAEYLVIDLVLNWVADGLLLAFFHAIKDKDPQANNDPQRKHEGWSNYCGARTMFPEEVSCFVLRGVSLTVQQIQVLQQAVASNVVLPARTRYPPTRVFQLQATGGPHQPPSLLFSWPPPRPPNAPGHGDGMYDAEEYAELMRGVDMDPSMLTTKPGEVRTNCTTRFGAEHSIRTEGVYRHVNSVFIPYGSLVFACYQTKKTIELRPTGATESWSAPQPQQSPATSPVVAGGGEWRPQPSTGGEFDNYPSSSQFGRDYPPPPGPGGPGYGAPGYGPGYGRMNDAAPAQPRPTGSSSRPLVRPPGDVEKCRGCGTRESPEWRKGENGVKDLCNACGLKLARAVAKREGRQKPRKKDKT